ncbi:hypothetical protein PICSAR56_02318 [Mycobacterium avium subsp. paratuberculosis]|nr:hypothetical protein PICSAR56_02318 [Mycobacterium avium subsp. paratuberculosis]
MKAQDKLRTATLRMLLAAIQTEEVSGKQAKAPYWAPYWDCGPYAGGGPTG